MTTLLPLSIRVQPRLPLSPVALVVPGVTATVIIIIIIIAAADVVVVRPHRLGLARAIQKHAIRVLPPTILLTTRDTIVSTIPSRVHLRIFSRARPSGPYSPSFRVRSTIPGDCAVQACRRLKRRSPSPSQRHTATFDPADSAVDFSI